MNRENIDEKMIAEGILDQHWKLFGSNQYREWALFQVIRSGLKQKIGSNTITHQEVSQQMNSEAQGYLEKWMEPDVKKIEAVYPQLKGGLGKWMKSLVEGASYEKNKVGEAELKAMLDEIDTEVGKADVVKLVEHLLKSSPKESGWMHVPESIRTVIKALVADRRIQSMGNYTCGPCLMEIDIANALEQYGPVKIYGQELNVMNVCVARSLMILTDRLDARIENEVPTLCAKEDQEVFDLVLCDLNQCKGLEHQLDRRKTAFTYGEVSKLNVEWAVIQHVVQHLTDDGMGIVIGSKGTLVRKVDEAIRGSMAEKGCIVSVITLPANLYSDNNLGSELLIVQKENKRKMPILMIDVEKDGERLNRNQCTISPAGLEGIKISWRHREKVYPWSRSVAIDKLREYQYALNPIRYIQLDSIKDTWRQSLKLGDVARITRGAQLSKQDLIALQEQPTHYLINLKDISDRGITYDPATRITYKKPDWLRKFACQKGDLIVTYKGYEIKVVMVTSDEPAFVSENLILIKVDPDEYNNYVLYEFLKSDVGAKMLESLQSGTTTKLLNPSKLEQLVLPDLDREKMNHLGERIGWMYQTYQEQMEILQRNFEHKREDLLQHMQTLMDNIRS